ncbi:DUF4158 domain-containing protein [Nocardiopsis aegyptia]
MLSTTDRHDLGAPLVRQDWPPEQLVDEWTLAEGDRKLLGNKSGATRLGFALKLKFFQIEGRFPSYAATVDRRSAMDTKAVAKRARAATKEVRSHARKSPFRLTPGPHRGRATQPARARSLGRGVPARAELSTTIHRQVLEVGEGTVGQPPLPQGLAVSHGKIHSDRRGLDVDESGGGK